MTENTKVDEVTSSRGAQWAGAGSLIAIAAQSLLGNGNGGGILGNVLGGGCNNAQNAAITALMTENAQLKADAKTDAKLVEVYTELRKQDKLQDAAIAELKSELVRVSMSASNGITALNGAVSCLQNTVAGITKTVVPNTAVCPGWGNVTVAPATTTAAAA